ncbi:BCCT family transporter [Clostridium sp. 'deep sea']|uniref:BCCT family transporter n=1 Tax=Clostridium sp. 'deep sea' TaxID=2779445 RepID=UPI0018964F88|nr:BCCT family transporter [Clostridium sp. 'deep sea']QOR34143.1 BCCT family transporter [Clostridium sp. 'deep sea']
MSKEKAGLKPKKGNSVFFISVAVVFAVVLWGIIVPKNFEKTANHLLGYMLDNFGWFYLIAVSMFIVFALGLAFSKYGKIKLGPDDSKPEYSNISWFSMLFSAGMGIGLIFWGVAEPLNHFINPAGFSGAVAGSSAAADFSIKMSITHWGFHIWATHGVMALALAYFQFRKGAPGLISSIFVPLIGEKRVRGPIGKAIDIFAIFATVTGVACSLGMGTLQINGGLNYLYGLPKTTLVQVVIIVLVTIAFMISAITGLNKGIKWLSNTNVALAFIILTLTILVGPTVKIISAFTNGMGMYISDIIRTSLHMEPFGDNSWIGGWTIFYWAWTLSWAPFVGSFIARISRGRTIKEFVLGVMVGPVLGSALWMATYGTVGMNLGSDIATKAVQVTETAFFVVMSHYPLGGIISFITVILLVTFFVTSADSATFVLGMFSSHGNLNPSTKKKIVWGIIQSLLAVALLLAGGGGIKTLQNAVIAVALPFTIILVLGCVSLYKVLKQDSQNGSSKKRLKDSSLSTKASVS